MPEAGDCRRNQDIIGNLAASAPVCITCHDTSLLPADDDVVAIMLGNPQGYVRISLFKSCRRRPGVAEIMHGDEAFRDRNVFQETRDAPFAGAF